MFGVRQDLLSIEFVVIPSGKNKSMFGDLSILPLNMFNFDDYNYINL